VEYLAAHFGTTLNINQANAGDIERFFPLSKDEAAAVVRYRETNGKFKAWDDLSKIPEFDVKKIENKKAFVTF
jgi:competence protein ComEA